jgi:dihydroorotate dehydrogenase
MVFQGASSIKSIVNGLDKKMKSHGFSNIEEAVGLARRV